MEDTKLKNFAHWDKDKLRAAAAKGGKIGTTGGFYNNKERASEAGKLGGRNSKRTPKFYVVVDGEKLNCTEAAKKLGVSRTTVFNRRANNQIEHGVF